jgi:hypothetical protein
LLLKAARDMFDAMPEIFHFHRASA